MENPFESSSDSPVTNEGGGNAEGASVIVVHKAYAFLTPVIQLMFEGAKDVRVIADRRFHDRRQQSVPVAVERRIRKGDRRRSSPMLDIIIAMNE
jgi:hypothetical protein